MEPITSRRSTLILLMLLFVSASVVFTVSLVKKQQELREKAAAATVLEFDPAAINIDQGNEFNINVKMRTGSNQVTRAELTINYDKNYLDGVSITPGSFMPEVALAGIIQNGVANLVLTAPTTSPAFGEGVLATIRWRARNPVAASEILFAGNTLLSALAEEGNALASANKAVIRVNRMVSADTVLSLVPDNITVSRDQQFNLEVKINTGSNKVTAADLTLNYDANILEGKGIDKTDLLPDLLPGGTGNTGGIARIALGSSMAGGISGEGSIARLSFKAINSGTTQVSFAGTTVVKAERTDENMLKGSNSSTVNVSGTGGADTGEATGGSCQKSAPLAPSSLSVATVDRTSVSLSWSESLYATHYGLVYGINPGQYIYGAANLGYTTSYTVRSLSSGKTYYFAVFAVNDCAPSNYSYEVSAKTYKIVADSNNIIDEPSPSPQADDFIPINSGQDAIPFLMLNNRLKVTPPALPELTIPEVDSQPKPEKRLFSPLVIAALVVLVVIFISSLIYFRQKRLDI